LASFVAQLEARAGPTAPATMPSAPLSPPMGWRSWNCYGAHVSQAKMEQIFEAMASRERGVSLLDLGYRYAGLDDGWQACARGYHDADGRPRVNTQLFPDMTAMVSRGHALGLSVGWYGNNCLCADDWGAHGGHVRYDGDVSALISFGFDSIKLDGCGAQNNITRWAELIEAGTRGLNRSIVVENCHVRRAPSPWHLDICLR
jgi:alpha-galactosidase